MKRVWQTAGLLVLVVAALTWPTAALAQFDLFGGDSKGDFGGFAGPVGDPVTVSAQFTTATDDRPAVLMVTADIQPGWHVYSLTQPEGGPQRTSVELAPSDQYRVIGVFGSFPKHESRIDQEAWVGLEIQEHADRVTWYVPIELAADVDPEQVSISGEVLLQACKQSCIPMTLAFDAQEGPGVEIGPLAMTPDFAETLADRPDASKNALSPSSKSLGAADGGAGEKTAGIGSSSADSMSTTPPGGDEYNLDAIEFAAVESQGSLITYLLWAFLGGLVLNLMPCVLPVIGLKVMSFVEQAGHSRMQAFLLNLWYSLGILSVFLVLGSLAIVAGLSWGEQFGSVTFNITMSSIVFVMALSLLGVWEIPIPGFIGTGKAQEAASQEGALGAFLKGTITTLLATPCIGPGIGGALGWAVKQPASVTLAIFTAIGIGMASPYLLIGARPQLIRFLPKPGAWMETFKQLMGFVLIGTVLFFLGVLPQTYLLPTLALLTCLGLACWVYSKTPITASSSEKSQTWALCSAITVGGVVFAFGYLHPLLNAEQDESWQAFSLAKLQQKVVEEGKTVLVDFSADWCANCKVLEKTVLHTEPVENAIRQNNVVTLYADNTRYPPEIKRTLQALKANGVPVIAVFPGGDPYRPIVFRDGYTRSSLVEAIEQASGAKSRASVATLPSVGR